MATDIEHIGFKPAHPGELLREDIVPALNMTVSQLAEHLGVSRQTLSALINERQSVSIEMAQKLGQAFKNGARFWLALQMQHDIWIAEQTNKTKIEPLNWENSAA